MTFFFCCGYFMISLSRFLHQNKHHFPAEDQFGIKILNYYQWGMLFWLILLLVTYLIWKNRGPTPFVEWFMVFYFINFFVVVSFCNNYYITVVSGDIKNATKKPKTD